MPKKILLVTILITVNFHYFFFFYVSSQEKLLKEGQYNSLSVVCRFGNKPDCYSLSSLFNQEAKEEFICIF